MNILSLTAAQAAATITRLLADVAQPINDGPTLRDPAGQRHGRRRQGIAAAPPAYGSR